MYIMLDEYNETYQKFNDLESLRKELSEMAENDTYGFSKVEVYDVQDAVKFDVLPIRIIFPEKE